MSLRYSSLLAAFCGRFTLLAVLVAALAVAGCGPSPAPVEEVAEPTVAPAPLSTAPTLREAAVVYVLAMNNAARCLEIARGALSIYDNVISEDQAEAAQEIRENLSEFFLYQTKPEQATAREIDRIITGRLERVRAEESQELYTAINHLVQAQKALCKEATASRRSQSIYNDKVDDAAFALRNAESEIQWLVEVSPTERNEVMAKYRSQLAAARQRVIDDLGAKGRVGDWFDATLDLPYEQLSAEEYAEEKKSWQEEQARKERQQLARQALHRDAIESWRSDAAEEAQFDIPGVDSGDSSAAPGTNESAGASGAILRTTNQQKAMERWYVVYMDKSLAARIAIDRYQAIGARADIGEKYPACRAVFSTSTDLLTDGSAFDSPEPPIGQALRQSYEAYKKLAQACFDDKIEVMEQHAKSADEHLATATQKLAPYRLAP
jgi:hypothetical protein